MLIPASKISGTPPKIRYGPTVRLPYAVLIFAQAAWDAEKARLLEDVGLKALGWDASGGGSREAALVAASASAPTLDAAAIAHGAVVSRLNRYALLSPGERSRVDAEGGLRVASDFGALAPRPSPLAVAWRAAWKPTAGSGSGTTRPSKLVERARSVFGSLCSEDLGEVLE